MNDRPDKCRPFPLSSLIAVSAVVIGLLAIVNSHSHVDFHIYFGGVHPILAGSVVMLLGIGAVYLLHREFGFCVWRKAGASRFAIAAALTLPFIAAITILDLVFGFPGDINVALPAALAFYPSMGLLAQLSLHVLPFLIVLLILSRARSMMGPNRTYIAIILASLPEAYFQIHASIMQSGAPTALDILLAAYLVLFGCVELLLYRRFDFAAMYAFRITYYAYWHVAWAAFRMQI